MKIAVNTQMLVNNMEGLGWFTYEVLKRIVTAHPEHEFTFIFGKGIDEKFLFADNVKAVNIGPPFYRPITWFMKFQFLLPFYLKRNKFDLFFSPDGWMPAKTYSKSVAVIHDINFEHHPKMLPLSFRTYYKMFFPRWTRTADKILTVSNYSKRDLVDTYNLPEQKIIVAYNGANKIFTPVDDIVKDRIKGKYTSGKDYFVYVGALHPRKNIENLFKAFDLFKISDKKSTKLVVVGERFYWSKEIEEAYNSMASRGDVIFTGRLSQEELHHVMASAIALTYVSFFEGFGIPIVEAMSCSVPVITSNRTSMPEIAADAALIVDPYSVSEISHAMWSVSTDYELRERLIAAGQKRKDDFSWDNTATQVWKVIESLL